MSAEATVPAEPAAGAEGVTAALGQWVADLSYERIPPAILAHMKTCLLDAMGCGLYGVAQPWGTMTAALATEWSGSAGRASLFAAPQKVAAPDAALANGTALHGFEIDDVHVASSFHPGAVVVPAALAIAEAHGLGGREMLAGLVAGYEIGIRLGVAAGTSHSTSGYHVTGTVGPVGAAAAGARLLGLDGTGALHALAIGATQASGLYAARMGAMAKRFHAGRAAQSGVQAAYLAARGFTGSTVALEAPFGGFFSTLNGQANPATMLDQLGERWETGRVGFKIYAACASAHTLIDALDQLMARGLTAGNLDHLTIGMSRKGALNVGWPYVPGEIVSAQMNGYYAAAMKLLDGMVFVDQFRPERLADPRALELIERMRIVHDPELDLGGAAKRHCVRVSARLNSGETLDAEVEQRRGSAEHPLSEAEIEAKFRFLAGKRLPAAAIDEIVARIGRIEDEVDLSRLADLIAGRAG